MRPPSKVKRSSEGICTAGSDVASSEMAVSIKSIEIFAGLSPSELETVSRQMTEKHFEPGDTIFTPGDACLKVFFVRSGRVRVKRGSACGREQTIDTLKAGESCACHPGDEGTQCASYAEALTACVVWFMPRDKFAAWIDKNHEASKALNRHLAGKLRSLGTLVEDLALNDSRARLIRRLLKTAAPDEARDGRWTVRISQEEIARDIGAARETVARQLSSLRRSKLIATGPRRIFLIDRPALQKLI